jgi:hypothetical protein
LVHETKSHFRYVNICHTSRACSNTNAIEPGYMGAATNIFTDLIYTITPLVYITRVQLNTRTVWGVRIVFLLGLMYAFILSFQTHQIANPLASTTTISALKLYEMKSLNSSPDPTYTSVNLSIYAIAEVFVGVFTACLPPLRKSFDQVLRKILPAGLLSSHTSKSRNSYAVKPPSNPSSHGARKSRLESDGDSDCGILGGEMLTLQAKKSQDEIVKTTQVSVTVEDREEGTSGAWV